MKKLYKTFKEQIFTLSNTFLFKNASYLIATQGVVTILGLLFWVIAARFYPSKEVGLGSALIAAIMLIPILSGLGFETGIVRFLPDEADKSGMVNTCLSITILSSLAIASILIITLPIWSPSLLCIYDNKLLIFTFLLFAVTSALLHMQRGVFQAYRNTKYIFIQDASFSIAKLILVIFLTAFGAWGIFFASGIGSFIALAISIIFLIRDFNHRLTFTIEREMVKKMFNFSVGNHIGWAIGALPPQILPLMVIGLLGADMTAYFRIAWSVSAIIMTVVGNICASLFIEGSYEEEKLRTNVITASKFIFGFIIPTVIALLIFADKVLLLFGQAYSQNATDLLRLLVIGSIITPIPSVYLTIKRVQKQIKTIIYISLIGTILTLALSYILMINMGLIGIGIGWLGAQICIALIIGGLVMGKEKWIKTSMLH